MQTPVTKSFQALADPKRREILRMLRERDMNAGEIGTCFNISAPSVSHHLSVLKNAELITARREGQNIIYSLNSTVIQEVMQEMLDIFRIGEGRTNAE